MRANAGVAHGSLPVYLGMHMFDRFLDWFERHKYGVIGTLMLHTMLLFTFAISSVGQRNPPKPPEPIVLELQSDLPVEPAPEHPPPSGEQHISENVTNRTSNTTAEASAERPLSRAAQQRMAEQVDQDLHNMEKQEFERLAEERKAQGKEIVVPQLDPSKFDKNNYMEKPRKPVKVEGLTTVSYDLAGRTDIILDVPAYLCKGQGRVVVRVAVDRSGKVGKAELDPGASSTSDACMVDNALSSAGSARFSSSSSAAQPQRGTITYIFLAQ